MAELTVTEDTSAVLSTSAHRSAVGEPMGDPTGDSSSQTSAPGTEHGRRSVDDLGPVRHLASVAMIVIAAIALSLALELTVVSGLQHRAAQQQAFDKLRKELAEGTAPVGQTNSSGRLLALSSPVALIDIPSIHVHQVVVEGTTSGVLMTGPGHRRDSPLPGQAGVSVILGRAAAYGGPFGRLHQLRVGAKVTVSTGQGVSTFKVIDLRQAGDRNPPPVPSGKGRLVLVTATGSPFVPAGILRVDADQTTPAFGSPPAAIPVNGIPDAEQPMATDPGRLWALVFWMQALVILAVGIVWSWRRWGRPQTWVALGPSTAVVGFFACDQFMRLLPNLL